MKRLLSTLTDKETIEIGNMSFIHQKRNEIIPYHSKKWKLHIFELNGKLEKIAIVDETKPLLHVDNLWSEEPNTRTSNDVWQPEPQFNWIEITPRLVITHYYVPSLKLLLQPESQYGIFNFLDNHGFMGERAVMW